MSESEIDDDVDVFDRPSYRDWTPEPPEYYPNVEEIIQKNPDAFDFDRNLEWALENALTKQQPWVQPTPHIETWGLKPEWTIDTVRTFFDGYSQVRWPAGTILCHEVQPYDDPNERFDTNTFFTYEWWIHLNDHLREYKYDWLIPRSTYRYLVLTEEVDLLTCSGWSDLYYKPFFGDNNWEPYHRNIWGHGDEAEDTRPAEYRGNRALYELGYEGKWSCEQAEIHLTQPLARGVEVSADALRKYREHKWKFDYLRERVDTMGDGKKSIGKLSQLPRDVLSQIFSSRQRLLLV